MAAGHQVTIVSNVVWIFECPMNVRIAFGFAPASISRGGECVPALMQRDRLRPASEHARLARLPTAIGANGTAADRPKTSISPHFPARS